jgi:hypothetical protein
MLIQFFFVATLLETLKEIEPSKFFGKNLEDMETAASKTERSLSAFRELQVRIKCT